MPRSRCEIRRCSEFATQLPAPACQSAIACFHKWLLFLAQAPYQGENSEHMATGVKAAHQKTRGTYGAERLHKELLAEGHEISLWKVKEIRRKHGLVLQRKRKFVRTTDSNHALPVAPNLLSQKFTQNACNRVWVSDITYIPTREGWLYLAGIKDLCSKEIVGFSLSSRMDTDLVINALRNAFHTHRPLPGLTLHSVAAANIAVAPIRRTWRNTT